MARKQYFVYYHRDDTLAAYGTAAECAKTMGCSVGSIYTMASRARSRKIRKWDVYKTSVPMR